MAAAGAQELNLDGVNRYASQEQVTSINQFSDVRPTDWAYQALSNLIERYGCVAGYPNGTYKGGQAMTRYEAAALLNACLDRITEVTDELRRLMKEFEQELAVLRGRVDGLEAKVGELEATQFSTTTKLNGLATFVLGANAFSGTARRRVDQSRRDFGATTFNYDVQLNFDTSFTGKDLLRTTLRAGNFDGDTNSFGGAGPSSLSQLEVAFQEDSGANVVGIDRLFISSPSATSPSPSADGWARRTCSPSGPAPTRVRPCSTCSPSAARGGLQQESRRRRGRVVAEGWLLDQRQLRGGQWQRGQSQRGGDRHRWSWWHRNRSGGLCRGAVGPGCHLFLHPECQ